MFARCQKCSIIFITFMRFTRKNSLIPAFCSLAVRGGCMQQGFHPGLCRHSKMDAVSKNVGIMSIAGFLARTQFFADGSQRARGVKLVNKASLGHEPCLCRVTEN